MDDRQFRPEKKRSVNVLSFKFSVFLSVICPTASDGPFRRPGRRDLLLDSASTRSFRLLRRGLFSFFESFFELCRHFLLYETIIPMVEFANQYLQPLEVSKQSETLGEYSVPALPYRYQQFEEFKLPSKTSVLYSVNAYRAFDYLIDLLEETACVY